MKFIKYFLTAIFIISFVLSCSLFNKLKEKSDTEKETTTSEEKEKTIQTTSQEDLNFYNAYIDVVNKISEDIESLHKSYLEEVPDPKTLKKSSMVFATSTGIAVRDLQNLVRDYKRSFYENGALGKLKPDNAEMKKEIETEFKSVLTVLEEYSNTAQKVIEYYSEKAFEKDLSPAKGYDDEMKASYDKTKTAFDRLNNSVKKYKPKREQRDLSKISNPDEKAVAALMNVYENTLDDAEAFYEKFEKLENNGEVSAVMDDVAKLEKNFGDGKNLIQSITYSDRTKYMKYSYEDYFSKTVADFLKAAKKFLGDADGKKMKEQDFNRGYDNVITYYNYMINAYNSSISTLNGFQVY